MHSMGRLHTSRFKRIFKTIEHSKWPNIDLSCIKISFPKQKLSHGTCLRVPTTIPVTYQNVFSDTNRDRVRQQLPAIRVPARPGRSKEVRSEAAVLIPLCMIDGEPSILLMKRSLLLNNHSGEICFPGGMKDDTDTHLIETALRETFEEVGLSRGQIRVWEQMNSFPSKKDGNYVTPVVALCENVNLDELTLNKTEVEEVFTASIKSLCDPSNQRQTQWRYPGSAGYSLPVFLIGEYRIWGLTAAILHMLMPLLAPNLYTFKLKHRR